MAARLLDNGIELSVFDIRREATLPLEQRGAKVAGSIREIADTCSTVLISLPTLAAFRQVVLGGDGLIDGTAIKLLVNTCTVGQPFVEEVTSALSGRNITLIDCPVSGGGIGAAAGTLSLMVSGDLDAIESLRPMLSLLGKITIAGSRPGAAQVLKLANNILSAVSIAATAEVFVMGAKAGLDPEVMIAAINAGSGRNSATEDKFPREILTRRFNQGSAMSITGKDVDLAIKEGESLGVPMWVCQAARLTFKHAIFSGAGNDDVLTIVKHIEHGANFEIPRTR